MPCSSFPFFPQEAKQKHRVKADKVRQNTPRPLRSLYFVCVRLMHLLLAVQPEIRIWRQSSGMIVIERYWILQLKVPARALVPVKKARYGACAGAEYHLSLSFVVWRRHHSCSVASAPSSRSQKNGRLSTAVTWSGKSRSTASSTIICLSRAWAKEFHSLRVPESHSLLRLRAARWQRVIQGMLPPSITITPDGLEALQTATEAGGPAVQSCSHCPTQQDLAVQLLATYAPAPRKAARDRQLMVRGRILEQWQVP